MQNSLWNFNQWNIKCSPEQLQVYKFGFIKPMEKLCYKYETTNMLSIKQPIYFVHSK